MLKGKLLGVLILSIFLISFINAESIGQRQDGQLNKSYIISQPCATCSYINISVFNKGGVVLNNVPMINNGSSWTYTFTPNDTLRYDVNGIGDKDGVDDSFAFFFDVTLSGERGNSQIIISDLLLLLSIIGIVFIIGYKHKKTDFDSWNENIISENKSTSQTLVNGILYGLFKNVFIWYYFLGWLFILILKDVIFRFNSADIYSYFTLIANIYSIGLLLVIVYMIGWTIDYMRSMANILTENNWGIDREK